jgi:hypothetical protein
VHSLLGYHNRNHDTLLSYVLSLGAKWMFWDVKQWKGDMYLGFQPLSVIMHDSNQLNKFWMSFSNIKSIKMQEYKIILEWHSFFWSAKNVLKTSNNVFFLHPCLLCFFPNLWNVIFLLKEINLIVFLIIAFYVHIPLI